VVALVVAASIAATVDIELTPIDAVVRIDRRFPLWGPWTMTGAGVGVSVSGLAVWRRSIAHGRLWCRRARMPRRLQPRGAPGACRCTVTKLEAKVGVIVMSVGVAGIIAGVTLGLLNGPRRSLPIEVPSEGGATALAGWSF